MADPDEHPSTPAEALAALEAGNQRHRSGATELRTLSPLGERHAEEATPRYEAAFVDHVSDAIIGTTVTGAVTSWNPAAEAIYGWTAEEALGNPVSALVGAEVNPVAIVASGGIEHATHRAAAGQGLEVRVSAAEMDDGFVLACCDLTALRRAEQHFEAAQDR